MQKLSVVLATFNEEKNLDDCLESIKDIASEIIIVDGSSTDNTIKIAKKYGAKVTVTGNPSIFHINKQKAIEMATSDWILQLDADERVSSKLKEEIGGILSQDSKQINGYWIPRKNWFLGKFLTKGGQYPDFTLRLYQKGKGYLPQKSVHEQTIVDGETGYLKAPLIHIADPNFKRYFTRFNRYTEIDASELLNKDKTNNSKDKIFDSISYLFIKPLLWFMKAYFRHKGVVDGWQGFIFAFFSSLRFPVVYVKFIRKKYQGK